MAGKSEGNVKGDLLRAFFDLVVLALLVCGSGFGGHWYGIHERLAPVQPVAPGTPNALPATAVTPAPAGTTTTPAPQASTTATPSTTPAPANTTATAPSTNGSKKAKKYWVASSGVPWTGYQIIVAVNDNQVDGFTGPGKSVDITPYVKAGENKVAIQAKELGPQYNKHKGDEKAELKVEIVSGPKITDEYKSSDVLLNYKRNAAEDEDFEDALTFRAGD